MSADLIQGSPEWLAARAGSLGASSIVDIMAKTKSGWGASRANCAARLIAERLTGVPSESFTNSAMQWGNDTESHARAAYSFRTDFDVVEVGLIRHPSIEGTHASPDGMVSDDGLVEIKCPNTSTHIDTLLGQNVPSKYIMQMQWQMACTNRAWCDFVSFDPRMPESMRFFMRRVERDNALIAELEKEVLIFLAEVYAREKELRAVYG